MIDEQWNIVMQPLYIQVMDGINSFTICRLAASEPVSIHTSDVLYKIMDYALADIAKHLRNQ